LVAIIRHMSMAISGLCSDGRVRDAERMLRDVYVECCKQT